MQLKAILAWSLTFASVSALPAEQCDAARLLSTISAINGSVQALQTYVDAYNGLYNQTTTLVSAFECLKTNIEKATSDTTSSLPFSLSESNIIADHLDDLTSWVVKCVVDLVGKSETVASDGYTSEVHNALALLKEDELNFFSALEDKVAEEAVSHLSPSQQQIDAVLQYAISEYTAS